MMDKKQYKEAIPHLTRSIEMMVQEIGPPLPTSIKF